MSKYQPYSEYKDSGVEWLDKIPTHWHTTSTKHLVDVRDGTHDTPSYVDPNEHSYPLVTSKDVTKGYLTFSKCKHISEANYLSIIQRSKVEDNDILMPMIGTVGSPIIVKGSGEFAIKNLALFKTSKSKKIHASFLHYFLLSHECNVQFDLALNGGVQDFVSLGTLRSLGIISIPMEEQLNVLIFLDRETTRIDTLIEKKTRFIALLKEKRQALISHAVTKGLDPDVEMMDSGVEWLGEVPAHWNVKKLKYISSNNDSSLPETTNPDHEIEYVDISSVNHTDGIVQSETMKFSDAPSRARRLPKGGDTIVSTVRTYLKAIATINDPSENRICCY